jgi:hypothetical protein
MANGIIVPLQASWRGIINLGGVKARGEFEVFDSGGGWAFLFGKPLLCAFKATHNFKDDTVTITGNGASMMLGNGIMRRYANEISENIDISLTLDMKQWESSSGGALKQDLPPREVTQSETFNAKQINCHTSADMPFREDEWTSLFADVEALERSM